jgi:VWA domain containing CoxE-like protein
MSKAIGWFLLAFTLALTTISAPYLGAQSATCEQWLVPVTVVSPGGDFASGLNISDFELAPHSSQSMKVVSVTPDSRPRRIVILIDISGSMAGPSSASWNVVAQFVRDLASDDSLNVRFALVLFSDHVVETTDFSQDRAAVDRRLKAISADPTFLKQYVHGRTALYDALHAGFQLLRNPSSADSLLVITDGGDTNSKTSPNHLLDELSVSSTRVFSIVFNRRLYERNDPKPEAQKLNEFLDFVARSGGDTFGPLLVNRSGQYAMTNAQRTSKPLPQELTEFYKEMLENSVMSLKANTTLSKLIKLELRPSSQTKEKWKGATLLYPREIGPCLSDQAL